MGKQKLFPEESLRPKGTKYPDDHLKDKIFPWSLHYSANKKHGRLKPP